MFLPTFNTKAMTDQELLETTSKVHKRIAYAARLSGDDMLMNQLRSMADACAFEAGEREKVRIYEMLNKNRKDETDLTPDEKSLNSEKTNGKATTKSIRSDSGFRTKRTTQPGKDA